VTFPDRVFAVASPLSLGGKSLFEIGDRITPRTVFAAVSDPRVTRAAVARLLRAGFEILHATPLTVNFAGPAELFESAFRTRIVAKEVDFADGVTTTHLDSPDTDTLGLISTAGTPLGSVIEGVALETPRYFFGSESPTPPPADYWHLDVPTDVASTIGATALHQLGVTGFGVRVAMVDSGWYRHAFFQSLLYNVAPVVLAPAAADPDDDESGHGTGESANLLAIAPGCELVPVKMNFVNTIAAFDAAVALRPDIITCSWGSNTFATLTAADMALSASMAAAVASGITVIFSAGNGHAGFPGQHPDVISAGGVYVDENGQLQASDYSSAFESVIYPGRAVPDVCGAVGMRPKAIYIMLPVQPGDTIDVGNAGSTFPDGDQTDVDDGWAAFSGTSAAAPQLAGVAALMKQVAPTMSPMLLREILRYTARDVVDGTSSPVIPLNAGLPAGVGFDAATGAGLVDAFPAVVTAYLANTFAASSSLEATYA
jgi:subtilisin family serine protease